MKILVVIDQFYPMFTGQGIFIERLLSELNNQNIVANVLTMNLGGKYTNIERVDNFIVHRINIVSTKSSIHYIKSFFTCILWFWSNRKNFDIIHLHNCCLQFWVSSILAKILLNKRIVFEMCLYGDDDPITLSRGRFGVFFKKVMLYIDHYIPLSEPIRKACFEVGIPKNKISKIAQMVDIHRYRPVDSNTKIKIRENLGLNKNSFYVVFTGSIIYRKGVDILIKAFENAVKNSGKDLILILIGRQYSKSKNGPTANPFATQMDSIVANSKYLRNRVFFTGLVDNVEKYLQASDLYVFPSRREGFGASTIEALAVGLPCIVSPLDGISKNDIFIGEKEGIIASLSVESFSSAIIELLNKDEEREVFGKNARKRAIESFSNEKIKKKYVDLFQRIHNINEVGC